MKETTEKINVDGRVGEKRIKESDGIKITEIFIEEQRPLVLHQRVVEEPIMVKRRIETISNGRVVESRTETLDQRQIPGLDISDKNNYATKEDIEKLTLAITQSSSPKSPVLSAMEARLAATDEKPQNKTVKTVLIIGILIVLGLIIWTLV